MEEMPNLSQDKQPEEPDEDTISRRELFSESWQRFRNRFDESVIERVQYSNYYEEDENSKREKDKDDDDEDELFTSGTGADSTYKKKSNRKLSKLRSRAPATAQLDEQSKTSSGMMDDYKTGEEVVASENDNDSDNEPEVQAFSPELVNTSSENTNNRVSENDIDVISESEAEIEYAVTSTEKEKKAEDEERLTPISKILTQKKYRRSKNIKVENNNMTYSDTAVKFSSRSDNSPAINTSSNQTQKEATNHNHHYYHRRIAALDILNYGLALRRDNKNRRLSDRKIKRLSDEVKKQFTKNESILYSNKTTGNVSERIIYNNNTVVETNNSKSSGHTDLVEIITTENTTEPRRTEQKVETTHQKSENMTDKKIEDSTNDYSKLSEYRPEVAIETKYERKDLNRKEAEIERLRSEYKKLLKESDIARHRIPDIKPIETVAGTRETVNKIPVSMLDRSDLKPQTNDYSQMIVPSISGILAGIVVFIILYMATMR